MVRILLPVLLTLAACSGTNKKQEPQPSWSSAQGTGETAPEEDRSFWDDFVDDEDGAFDVSDFLNRDIGFLPLVVPITEPAIGFGLVGGLVFFHDKDEPKKGVPPTVTAVVGGATTNDTWLAGLIHQHVWKDGALRYLGGAGYANVNLDFFGIGSSPDQDRSTDLNFEGFFILQEIEHRIGQSKWFAGVDWIYADIDTTLQIPILPVPPIRLKARSSGIGAFFTYESRDNLFTPSRGIHATLGARWYDPSIGSDNEFYKLRAHFRSWVPVHEKVVLGIRLDGDATTDDAPLYEMSWVKLRGVPAFRYVDNIAITAELEPRFQISDRWGAVVFAGGGMVLDNAGDFSDESVVWAAGAGFRYMLARQRGIQAGIDVAYSDDEVAFYITVGSAWMR